MNIYIIILIAIAASLLGAAVAYWIIRSSHNRNNAERESSEELRHGKLKIEQLEEQIKLKEEKLSALSETIARMRQNNGNADVIIAQEGDEGKVVSVLQQEVEKLKKKLQDAETEIEELEDESSSYKRKYNDQRNKVSEVEAKVGQFEKDLKELQESLEAAEADVKNKSELLTKKGEAIDFVNEILLAKDADNKDAKEINQKVSDVESFVGNDLCSVLDQLKLWGKEEKQLAKDRVWQWANLQRKTWLQGKKVIAFVGEFSAGKTSIVNRILSQDNSDAPKLPVSSKATTAIATYISYGSDFNSQFTDSNGKLKNISKETFEKVDKEILQEVNISPMITYFVMSYNNSNLLNLSILDTPGFSSNDKEDAKRTADVIKEADALFWVFDANTGEINQTSLKIIQEYLQGLPLYVVINKADTKSPNELDKLKIHIQETIGKNSIAVKDFLFFSQQASLDELMAKINEVPKGNNKDAYVYELYAQVEQKLMELQNDCKKSRKSLLDAEKENENILDDLKYSLDDIGNRCENVNDIPEERGFLGIKTRGYKMSEDRYNEFCNELQQIMHTREKIRELSENLQRSAQSIQEKRKSLGEVNNQRRLMDDVLRRFEKMLSNWQSDFKTNYQNWKTSNGK